MQRKLTSILSMDVVGYSRLTEHDEIGTVRRLKEIRQELFDPSIERHSGRTIKLMGDGALMEFNSIVDALGCAIEIQTAMDSHNNGTPQSSALQFRAGLHLGDVIIDGDDIYGDGVNVAARLEALAAPGGIVLSRQVFDQISGKLPVSMISLGEQTVKNLSRPIDAFKVDWARSQGNEEVLKFDTYEIDTGLFELRESGRKIPLEPQAFDLLVLLARNAGRIVTKDEIFSKIWDGRIVSESALSSQVKAARRAVGDTGSRQAVIATVHGRGFRFVAEMQGTPEELAPVPMVEMPELDVVSTRPSVAILPFKNMNADSSEDYLADGITEDITIAVAKNRWLTVVARNPAFSFRNFKESLRVIGEKLEAQYLVTGSMRKAGSRFRIAVEIVDAETELRVWSERFDRDGIDIFDLQDEISEMVAARIESELGLAEQKKAERTSRKNRGAWDLYQLGSAEFYKFTPEGNLNAQQHLRASIDLDSTLAAAHSRLAYAITLSMIYFDADTDKARMDEALVAARRAIELDDQDANGYFTLGRVHLARQEYGLAIEALEHALELNPCLAVTYCGLGDSLAYEGRLDEAIKQFEIAIRLSPHDPFRWAFYSYRSLAHLFRGEYQTSVEWARRSIRVPNAQYWAWAHLVAALGHIGKESDITAARVDLLQKKPEFTVAFAQQRLFYLKLPGQLEMYLDGLRRSGITEA